MKRVVRSKLTKTIAFLLILACTAVSVALVVDVIDLYAGDRVPPYGFENSFEESDTLWRAKAMLRNAMYEDSPEEAARLLDMSGYAVYYIETPTGVITNMPDGEASAEVLLNQCPSWFSVTKGEPTNDEAVAIQPVPEESTANIPPAESYGDVMRVEIYPAEENAMPAEIEEEPEAEYHESGNECHDIWNDWPAPYAAYVGIDSVEYDQLAYEWYASKEHILTDVYIAVGLVLLALGLWVYLLAVCGRKVGDDEVHTLIIDRAYIELMAAPAAAAIAVLAIAAIASLVEGVNGAEPGIMIPISMFSAMAAVGIFTAASQSIVRNIKNGTFLSRLLCLRILKYIWKTCGRVLRGIKKAFSFLCGNRISAVVLALFAAYNLVILFLGLARAGVIAFFVFVAAGYFMYRYLVQLDKIKTGIFQIRNGNTDYKIEGCTSELLKNTADALNSINEGVKIGVEREVKAQRMKSELITNVSHDLKTPLTSIISYADLLAGLELSPSEANDYAKIIKQKGDSLKKLTNDLFDISKAESGNETVVTERLDIALLLRQSMAELNNEIENSGLTFIPTIPEKEVFVNADGKKLSRVFENLLVNAIKYSMKGTRVYVELREKGGEAVMEIKNISAAPMNFDPSEITERFVRGDASRSTEGSGLGLAIAKSYTELCGGRLEIDVDGDLFKAAVRLKTAGTLAG